jgi:hypothetical protein
VYGAAVDRLAAELRPVRRLRRPGRRLLVWLLLEAAVLALVASGGLRHDLVGRLASPRFVAELAVLVVAGGLAATLALRAAVPGREPRGREGALVLVLVMLTVLAIVTAPGPAEGAAGGSPAGGAACTANLAALATIPWLGLLFALRRGAPVVPAAAGALAGAAAMLVAAAILRVACPHDGARHLLEWHLAPLLPAAALSAWAGAVWLPRWRGRAP